MSKGLKALQEIQRQVGNIHYFDFSDNLPRHTSIELRESGLFEIIEKELKALEIIKEKKVDLEYLKCCENYEQYKIICSYWNEISKQEFDSLKEVLL